MPLCHGMPCAMPRTFFMPSTIYVTNRSPWIPLAGHHIHEWFSLVLLPFILSLSVLPMDVIDNLNHNQSVIHKPTHVCQRFTLMVILIRGEFGRQYHDCSGGTWSERLLWSRYWQNVCWWCGRNMTTRALLVLKLATHWESDAQAVRGEGTWLDLSSRWH